MGLIKFDHYNKTIAIVRNHKCATTTMLSYVAQALWNADPKEFSNGNTVFDDPQVFDGLKVILN